MTKRRYKNHNFINLLQIYFDNIRIIYDFLKE